MIAKTKKDIEMLRRAGKALAEVLQEVSLQTVPGVSTAALNAVAEKGIRARGATPSFLGYQPDGAAYPFPAALCVSINEEIVHGIPREGRVIEEGDIVSLDLGLALGGYFVDSAITVCVGMCSPEDRNLVEATKDALDAAVQEAIPGATIGNIGAAVERVSKERKFTVIRDLGGHAVGKEVHEEPYIPNYGKKGKGEMLPEGMVLALEPMLSRGSENIVLDEDDAWTYRTADASRAAHFEHTILITKDGPEVLTQL